MTRTGSAAESVLASIIEQPRPNGEMRIGMSGTFLEFAGNAVLYIESPPGDSLRPCLRPEKQSVAEPGFEIRSTTFEIRRKFEIAKKAKAMQRVAASNADFFAASSF
jgi:hypothetical protein